MKDSRTGFSIAHLLIMGLFLLLAMVPAQANVKFDLTSSPGESFTFEADPNDSFNIGISSVGSLPKKAIPMTRASLNYQALSCTMLMTLKKSWMRISLQASRCE